MRFTDKVCLVTGGGSGIGKATCERFAREGGKVIVVDLKEEHGNATVQAIVAPAGTLSSPKQTSAIQTTLKRRSTLPSANGAVLTWW